MMRNSLTLLALLAVASAAPAMAEQQSPAAQAAAQAEVKAEQAAAEAAKAAQIAARAAQEAAQAAAAAAKEANSSGMPAGKTQDDYTIIVPQSDSGQARPAQAARSSAQMQDSFRMIRKTDPLPIVPPSSGTQEVVNGADVGDFLGSGVQLDRRAMDGVVDREYNSLVRLDPLKPGEVAPSVNPDVENAALAQAKQNQPKQHGFKAFIHGCANAVSDVGAMIGFPIGPDDDDARMDKFDDM